MRQILIPIVVIMTAFMITSSGCGGSGSSSGGGGDTHSTNGSLSASMTILGGQRPYGSTGITPGSTLDVQLQDHNGNLHTITSVYSPDSMTFISNTYCTVIRAGSVLLSGTYTSKTAKYINADENLSSTIPLTATGALAKDTIIPSDGTIILPISAIGSYSFPNGISVTFNTGTNNYSVQNNTLSFTATIPAIGKTVANAGQMIFTDTGTVSPQGAMHLNFASTDGLSGVIIQTPSSMNAISPVSLEGKAAGTTTAMTSAAVYYDLED